MLLLQNLSVARRFLDERVGMKLAREVFYGRNDTGSRTIHRIANHGIMTIANRIENLPSGETGERLELRRDRL